MNTYGLIGWPLGHSFSKKYFTEKFAREGIAHARYELFPLSDVAGLPELIARTPGLRGLNVTIPHKEAVLPFLQSLDDTAAAVGAVNCIRVQPDGSLKGYNTDVIGFEQSLLACMQQYSFTAEKTTACILGTGGAAKAVAYVLQKRGIPHFFVSRSARRAGVYRYEDLPQNAPPTGLIVNCTPLGTYPDVDAMPPVPLEMFQAGILVYDLVYNPAETLLLREAAARGCFAMNGLEMLHLQAEAAWEIWQS